MIDNIQQNKFGVVDFLIAVQIFSLHFLFVPATSMYTYYISIVAMIGIMLKNGFVIHIKPLSKGYLAFMILCWISVFYSVDSQLSIKRSVLVTLMWMYMVSLDTYCFNKRNLEFVINCFRVAGPALVLYVILKNGFYFTNNYRFGHGIINENGMAFLLLVSISFDIREILCNKDRSRVKNGIVFVICLMGIFLCSSRTVFAALLAEVAILLIMRAHFNIQTLLKIVLVIVLAVGMYAILLSLSSNNEMINIGFSRFMSVFQIVKGNSDDLSVMSRSKMIDFGLQTFKEKPIMGHGIDSFKALYPYKVAYAHNNYIELLVDLGVFGLLVYYFPYMMLVYQGYREWKNNKLSYNLAPLIVAMLVLAFGTVYYDLESSIYILVISSCTLEQLKSNYENAEWENDR